MIADQEIVDDPEPLFLQRSRGETGLAAYAVDSGVALRGLDRRLRRFDKLRP